MPLQKFRLKVGSHTIGSGENARFYDASDSTRNIIESEQNLAQIAPEKFEKYDGPPQPQRDEMQVHGQINPPPPPTDMERAEAMLQQALTQTTMMDKAKQLREMADRLEQRAQGGGKMTEQSAEVLEQSQSDEQQGYLSHGQRLGQAESHQMSQEAKQAKAPERSQSPIPQDQSSLPPEKQRELAQKVDEERRQGQPPSPQQQTIQGLQGQQAPPQSPTGDPAQRAREQQQQQGKSQQQPATGTSQQQTPKQRFMALPADKQREEDAKLDRMNVTQLREMAEEEEIEVPANANKVQLQAAIRNARRA